MISISTLFGDSKGNIVFEELLNSSLNPKNARMEKPISTLDGGVYIYNGGFSDAGRTVVIKASVDAEQEATLSYILDTQLEFLISMPGGLFIAVASYSNIDNGSVDIDLFLKQRVV